MVVERRTAAIMTAARAAHLLVRIDPRTREPLQNQIYASIRRAILDGVVAPGARLPSSRALAADLGISRTTTVLAFDQLAAEGYLTARGGSGTFVTRELPDDRPRAPAASRIVVPRHPPLSRRGLTLAATPRSAVKIEGAPRAFRIGTPGLDCFPTQVWTRLASRRLKSVTMAQLDYGDAAGLRALREAIADHVQRARGTSCTSEQVIVVTGAQHGLELISRLLVDPGDTVWMEEPGYPGARGALIAAGARPRPIPVDAHGLKIELGARRAGDARLVYVTPSHQFPLGVPLILARRLALLAWARAARAWIVEDDYDSEFRYGTRPIPCLHGLDVDGRVIYVGSFSKTLFPALRLGFLIVPTDLRDAVIGARRAADIHSAAMDQSVLADFIGGGHFERHLRRMRTEYGARLDALFQAAARHCRGAMDLRPVTTGLHAVADLHGADDRVVFEEAWARGVEAMPLSAYSFDRRAQMTQALVLGFAPVRPELMNGAMERLAAAIEAARRRARRRRGRPGLHDDHALGVPTSSPLSAREHRRPRVERR
jgi:GntR family transcriptional regulator / MocR family aminotransferase